MEITLEIAKIMLNSGIEELVDIALKAFPELEEVTEESKVFSILQRKIARVNKGKKPDLKKSDVYKYYPVFTYNNGVFSFCGADFWSSSLAIPALLCFADAEDCKAFVKENLKLYQQLYEGGCF